MTEKQPLIAIGIEVAGYDYIMKWIEAGHLPALAGLAKKGISGKINSTSDISSGTIWPTFYTGVSPAKNGQFFTHMQLVNGTYKIDKKYANDVKREPFWLKLSKEGRRVAIIDVAQTYPMQDFNGVQICGWGAEYPAWKQSSWPPNLINDMISKFGKHPLEGEYRLSIKPESPDEYDDFISKLLTGLERKGKISEYILKQEKWDFFLTMFPETHWAMHLLWQVFDKDHPAHNPEVTKKVENIFLETFKAIDNWIGRFIEIYPEADFIVFSGSGMGPNYCGWHLLPEILVRLGLGPSNKKETDKIKPINKFLPSKKWGAYRIRKVEDTLSIKAIETLRRIIPRRLWDKWTRTILFAGTDWENSKAFSLPNDNAGAIRINLKGREPKGIVEPGEEYNSLCKFISEELSQLINVDTGKTAIEEVIRIDEIFSGDNINDLPDLIIKWKGDAPIRGLQSPKVGSVYGENPERRSGGHRSISFFIGAGPNFPEEKSVDQISIMDIAPTILHLQDVSIPEDYDGKVIGKILRKEIIV
jgi:predicted AlkP superfamily phosphohydrolase/phosphomutase